MLAKVRFCKQNTEVSSQDSAPIAKRIGITLDNMIVVNDLYLFFPTLKEFGMTYEFLQNAGFAIDFILSMS